MVFAGGFFRLITGMFLPLEKFSAMELVELVWVHTRSKKRLTLYHLYNDMFFSSLVVLKLKGILRKIYKMLIKVTIRGSWYFGQF